MLSTLVPFLNATVGDVVYKEEEDPELPSWAVGLAGVCMVTLTVMAVFGNLVVIISYFRDRGLQTVHNMYILNLAVADLFIGTISMAFYTDFTIRKEVWVFGVPFCKLWSLSDYTMCLQSVFIVVLLSLDRLVLLRNGTQYLSKETKKVARVKLAIAWTVAFCIYGPAVVFWDIIRGSSIVAELDCDVEFGDNVPFNIAVALFEFTIPLTALTILNTMVFLEIRKRLKHVSKNKVVPETTRLPEISKIETENITEGNKDPRDQPKERKTRGSYSGRRDIKAAKFLAVLVMAFLICWAPYTVATLVVSVCEECVDWRIHEAFTWLLWAKSSINPFLYASQSSRFKQNFIKLLPCLRLCFTSTNIPS